MCLTPSVHLKSNPFRVSHHWLPSKHMDAETCKERHKGGHGAPFPDCSWTLTPLYSNSEMQSLTFQQCSNYQLQGLSRGQWGTEFFLLKLLPKHTKHADSKRKKRRELGGMSESLGSRVLTHRMGNLVLA